MFANDPDIRLTKILVRVSESAKRFLQNRIYAGRVAQRHLFNAANFFPDAFKQRLRVLDRNTEVPFTMAFHSVDENFENFPSAELLDC